jgi:hypothetical protein
LDFWWLILGEFSKKRIGMRFKEFVDLPVLKEVYITDDGESCKVLREGKWVSGRFNRNIRMDQPTHGVGQMHAHIYGRKGDEIGVVNFDGSASHGTKCRLSDADADALRASGFNIRSGNIVEWVLFEGQFALLFG